MKLSQTIAERNESAKEAELNEHIEEAIRLYELNIKEEVTDQFAYDRLMVIYRKQKAYNDELRVIKRGIQLFTEQTKKQLKENISTHKNKTQLERLSNAFMKGAGLIDKKGNDKHVPEPVNKWMKRQAVVEKKLKGKKKK
jgi:hypothetical protein